MKDQRKIRHMVFRLPAYIVWSTGNITDELVQEYLEHYGIPFNEGNDNFILE